MPQVVPSVVKRYFSAIISVKLVYHGFTVNRQNIHIVIRQTQVSNYS